MKSILAIGLSVLAVSICQASEMKATGRNTTITRHDYESQKSVLAQEIATIESVSKTLAATGSSPELLEHYERYKDDLLALQKQMEQDPGRDWISEINELRQRHSLSSGGLY